MDLAVNYLDNLTRVPRFDTLIMFLPSSDNAGMHASSIPISMWYISDKTRPGISPETGADPVLCRHHTDAGPTY
ncbi:unnamed protein product [Prunus armeniaca]